MLIIHQDKQGNRLADEHVINPVIKREVNGNDTFEFECNPGIFNREDFVLINFNNAWHEYVVKDIVEDKRGAKIYCENSIVNLYSDYIDDIRVNEGSAFNALQRALENTTWSVGSVDSDVQKKNWNAYHVSAYEAVQTIIELWGLEVETEINVVGNKVSSRRVHLRRYIEKDYGERFEYRKNLKSVTRKILKDEIFTAMYGYGKGEQTEGGGYGRRINFADVNNGLKYVADEQARQKWGKPDYNGNLQHRYGVVVFSDCEDVEELKDLTIDYLNTVNKPAIEYDVEAYDVDTALGNAIVVIDDDLGVELKARIVKDEFFPDEKRRNVTIGNYQPIMSSFTSNIERKVEKKVEQANQSTVSYIDLVRAEAIEAGSNKDAFIYNLKNGNDYGLPAGLYNFDRAIDDNPTVATWSAAGYTYHSDSKNPDGTWNWTTISTPDGYIAENMFASTINAGLISMETQSLTEYLGNTKETINAKIDGIEVGLQESQSELRQEITSNTALIDSMGLTITEVSTTVDGQGQTISENYEKITTIEAGQIDLQNNVNNNHEKITLIEAGQMHLQSQVDSNQSKITTIESGQIILSETVTQNTTIDDIPVSAKMGEVLDGIESINARIDGLEEGGGNMIRNPTLGTGIDPDPTWWSDGNTYQELKARKVTWGALKNKSKKWSDTKGGLV